MIINKRNSVRALMLSLTALASAAFIPGCSDNGMDMGPNDYVISLMTPKHFHAFTTTDTLFFQVTNAGGEAKAGLSPTCKWQLKGSTTFNTTAPGQIVDNHDGLYYWVTSFPGAGFYVLDFSFEHMERKYRNAFGLEASWAGGERIFLPDSANAVRNYQIRWNIVPGTPRGGIDTATFQIELKRSINTPVITDEPYTNMFEHLAPSDLVPAESLPVVKIESATGSIALPVVYKGLGKYQGKMVLPTVGTATTYWLHVTFSDSTGTVDQGSATVKDYKFTVYPAQ